ncbi:patched domain-containing protein 3-like [Clytia hemisphaerica]|uniref:SSD domain-containing protein n=1 Tax=Clytia hemisphaerica TaxID=252671 RepID=A0A7M5VCM2_9CNID
MVKEKEASYKRSLLASITSNETVEGDTQESCKDEMLDDDCDDSRFSFNSFCQEWVDFCLALNGFFEKLFYKLGFLLASNPTLTVIFGVIVPLFLTGGFFRFKMLQRTEDLYIPEKSQAFEDLRRAEKFFPVRVKAEQFIVKPHNRDRIFHQDTFRILLQIHQNITRLPNFHQVCIKNHFQHCTVLSPLEIFKYDATNFIHIKPTLDIVFNNKSIILSNGRQAFTSFPYYFGQFQFDHQRRLISGAESIHSVYLVKDPIDEDIYNDLDKFDRYYTQYMEKTKTELKSKGFDLMYTSALGIETSISESAMQEVMLIPVAFILMTIFCAITLLRFKNQVGGHFMVAFSGIICLFLGIGSAFGLIMMFGQPYIAFAGVLPFLVLGVGIDNIFIIIHAIDRQDPEIRGPYRVAKALSQIGASITMATMTTIVAFFVSMFTYFPAIRYFCFYAGLSILFCYIQVLTVFISLLSFDVRRIENKRRDVIFCFTEKLEGDVWERAKDRVSLKLMKIYSRFLLKTPVKYTLFTLSLVMTGLGVIGAMHIDQSFDKVVLCAPESPYVEFYNYFNRAFPIGDEVSVIVDTPLNYGDPQIQHQYSSLSQVCQENRHVKHASMNWMSALRDWSTKTQTNITGPHFIPALHGFLKMNPFFYPDVIFDNRGNIKASRMIMYLKDNTDSDFLKKAMLTLRSDLREKNDLPVYAISYAFIFYEQYAVILQNTIRNIAICATAILVITLPYLVNPKVTLLVFYGFISLMFELFGIMYVWGVSLNALSMIILVMGIGFSVDYSAHIAHAFVKSKKRTARERVYEALETMGSSVAMGGVSTFIGVMVKAFAVNEIFKIFFKMVFGIVILGLVHGLIILPIHLELFCRGDVILSHHVSYRGSKETNIKKDQDKKMLNGNGLLHHEEQNGNIDQPV